MEKCPKCRGQFSSKSGFITVNYKGQNQLVCPDCYQYLNYEQIQLEKKKKLNTENEGDIIKPVVIEDPLDEPSTRSSVRASNRKPLLQHQNQKKVVVRTTDDFGLTIYSVVTQGIRKKPKSKMKSKEKKK
jgi:hypothetical protein